MGILNDIVKDVNEMAQTLYEPPRHVVKGVLRPIKTIGVVLKDMNENKNAE